MQRNRNVVAGLLLAASLFAVGMNAKDSGTADAERYIIDSEMKWAEASMKRDTATVERILADDFVGEDPSGTFFRKPDELAGVGRNVGEYVSAKGNEVKVRFYDDAAVAQGSESWEKRSGERGRYVWTDTWIRRSGKWQIVAAVDVKVPEPSK